MWFLSHELFRNKRIAWLTSTLYVMLPFTTWYDRMALYDSMVSTFSVWSLYLGILLAKRLRLDTALLLGMVLAGGMLNKSSGFLSLYFLPVTLLVFDWQKKHRILLPRLSTRCRRLVTASLQRPSAFAVFLHD